MWIDGVYFNPRSREGSDPDISNAPGLIGTFQSTLPRRERPFLSGSRVVDTAPFQSTLPRRERRVTALAARSRTANFNPRSREGSDPPNPRAPSETVDFNPRSREGSDASPNLSDSATSISIHAPAKGATLFFTASLSSSQFQSTLPRRERPFAQTGLIPSNKISIHAPAKGATTPEFAMCRNFKFQSTLPRRERHRALTVPAFHIEFQSTLPRRERRSTTAAAPSRLNFNPRSREGSDLFG